MVDFPAVLDALRVEDYDGWIVVEQDVLPGLGTPAASAAATASILARLGLVSASKALVLRADGC